MRTVLDSQKTYDAISKGGMIEFSTANSQAIPCLVPNPNTERTSGFAL